ncbi:MAG: exopolysaccharide production protein [Microbacteriaceae bacterium]|nr:MAG: exopolysaccharide production protein [Microbacteriaceae bacterium]
MPAQVRTLFESAQFASALSVAIVGTAFGTYAIRSMIGWPGLLGILAALTLLAIGSFIAHRGAIEWQGLLPISILAFVGWCGLSIIWSGYQWATLAAIIYQVTFAFLAVYLALVRDAIQIVRTVGDVLRVLLTLSLALEVLSGLLINLPITFLGIQGNIAEGGPLQGIFGTRNQFGLVALIGLVTFLVELRTRSVQRGRAIFSIALAAACTLLSNSPVTAAVAVLVLVATLALYGLRKVKAAHRTYWQLGLGVFAVAAVVVGYLIRARIIELLSAGSLLNVRYNVWIQMWDLIPTYPLQGWGWIGFWRHIPPYVIIDANTGARHANGLNAYLDLYLQVGLIGLALFVALVVLAFARSWVLASNKRSVIYVWPPLVLVAMLATAFAESSLLIEYGWLLLVICAVKGAQGMSWRSALPHPSHTGLSPAPRRP